MAPLSLKSIGISALLSLAALGFVSAPVKACGGDICDFVEGAAKGGSNFINLSKRALGDIRKTIEKAAHDTSKAIKIATHDVGTTVEKAAHDTGSSIEKAGHDVGRALEIGAQDIGKSLEKAAHDVGKSSEKAGQDTWKASTKAVSDVGNAVDALSHYVENQVKDMGKSDSDFDRRLKEGKLADAIWHYSTDPLRNTERNAATAAQESEILATVGQVAASAYGGPWGAAAYAAWLTYRRTGDAELALRVGVITGLTSEAMTAAGSMPSTTNSQIAAKVATTGAIGGLSVAAMGGDSSDIREAFLLSAGKVLVETGYERYTGHPLDAKGSKGEAFCKEQAYAYCSASGIYVTDEEGNIKLDKFGRPQIRPDQRLMDPSRPHVGTWSTENDTAWFGTGERTAFMTGVSRVPGMNAMAYLHDMWVDEFHISDWLSKATIVPTTLITYLGTGAPYFNKLMEVGIARRPVEIPIVFVKPAIHRPQALIPVPPVNGDVEVLDGVIVVSPTIEMPLVREVVPSLTHSAE